MRQKGRGGAARQRREGEGRGVGGRTDRRSDKKFISINNHRAGGGKKESWQTSTENWHVLLEAGS